MRILLSILIFTFTLFAPCVAQDHKAELDSVFQGFWEVTEKKDAWGTMDYMYPRLFEIAPKKMLVNAIQDTYADTTVELGFSNSSISNISSLLVVEETKYASIDYSFTMSIALLNLAEEDVADMLAYLLQVYQDQYGKNSVRLDEKARRFDIDVDATMYAIHAPEYGEWKVIEKKPEYQALFEQWFPKKVLKKL